MREGALKQRAGRPKGWSRWGSDEAMSDLSISVLRWGLATSDAEGRASDNNDLDWADLIRYGDSPMTWSIRSPSIGWRLKWRCSESEGLRCWRVAVFRFALGPLVNFFLFFIYKAFSDFWFRPLGNEALILFFFFFFFFENPWPL